MRTLASLLLAMLASAAFGQTCTCGPTYCTQTPGYAAALATKKARVAKDEAPPRLVALFDRLDKCEASINTAPDGFSILRRASDGSITVDSWTPENESNDAAALQSGKLTACRVIVSRRAFACCGGAQPTDRKDYDAKLDLNTDATVVCAAKN